MTCRLFGHRPLSKPLRVYSISIQYKFICFIHVANNFVIKDKKGKSKQNNNTKKKVTYINYGSQEDSVNSLRPGRK